MKIAFVLDDTLDTTDGVQQYVLTLGKWLTNQGHEVHYLVGETTRNDIPNIHSLAKNISVRFNRNRMSIPLPADRANIKRLLANERYDVIHVQMPYSPQMAARVILAAPAHTAIVATFHILPYGEFEKIGTKLLAKTVKRSFKKIDQVISVSRPAALFAKQSYKVETIIVPNPVAIPKQNESTVRPNKTRNIVYLGRLVKRKGIMEFIDALNKLKNECDFDFNATIIGKGPLENKAKHTISANGLTKNVTMTGFVSEETKFDMLSKADVAVFPSLGGESFGIVIIEAIAAGAKVVIGGDNPGYRSVLEDNRTLFNPKDIDDFAEIMMVFLTNNELQKKVRRNQLDLLKKFDINTIGPRISNIYTELIAKHKNNKDNI